MNDMFLLQFTEIFVSAHKLTTFINTRSESDHSASSEKVKQKPEKFIQFNLFKSANPDLCVCIIDILVFANVTIQINIIRKHQAASAAPRHAAAKASVSSFTFFSISNAADDDNSAEVVQNKIKNEC